MQNEKLLMTPGPTMLPPEVLEVMRRQIIHHRTADFEKTWDAMHADLKDIFQTEQPVMTMASSGTGAMEAAIVNLFSPGEKVLAVSVGAFGDRLAQMAETFGLQVEKLSVEWGKVANPAEIKAILDADSKKEIKGVLITYNETSTGVSNDIKAVAALTKDTDRLLVVDAVSAMGGLEFQMDAWGVDCVFTGSQKAFMAPPGLSFIALSPKAWEACERSTMPKFYWDLKKYKKGLAKLSENPPYTPAITTVQAQAVALKRLKEEGLEQVYRRHERFAKAVQKGVLALGLELLPAQEVSSYIVTAVKAPEGINIGNVIKTMNNQFDIMLAGGQKHLKGKIFRIGHCGYVNEFDIIKTFAALEQSLAKEGYAFEAGAGVSAVQKALFA